jgi:hypothetical protein
MSKPRLADALLAIGSAHAGEPLTHEQLLRRLLGDGTPEGAARAAAFRARFNRPAPPKVTFPDEETAALATAFENAGRRTP